MLSVVVCALGVVERYLPRLGLKLHVELGEQLGVVGYVEQRPEASGVALIGEATIGAGGPPSALEGVDIALPSAAGANGAPHLLLDACGHGLLGRVGEVDARDVEEASPLHVLDDLVADPVLSA